MRDFKLWLAKYKMPFGALAMIVGLLIFSGCSSVKQIEINIQGMPEMNRGHAVVVYICQLKNDRGFLQASPESFWREGDKPFQEELIKGTLIKLFPGDQKIKGLNIESETKFIGVAADFFDPDEKAWRQIYPLSSGRLKQIVIIVTENKIEIR